MTNAQRPPMRLSQGHERWLYAIGGLVFLSGLGWLIAHYFFAASAEFGDAHAASEPLWLRLHGAAAMAALVIFGSLLPGHMARAWSLRQNHRSGVFMLSIIMLLVLTSYGLYYAGDEEIRPWISAVHWIVGIIAAAGLVLHVRLGKRSVRRKRSGVPHNPVSNPAAAAADREKKIYATLTKNAPQRATPW